MRSPAWLSTWKSHWRRDARTWIALALVAVAYIAAGRLGLAIASFHPSASPIWPPSGLSVAAFLIVGPMAALPVFVGALAVNWSTSGDPWSSLVIALGNMGEGWTALWLVRRLAAGRRAFEQPPTVFRFLVLAGPVACAVSATIGVGALVGFGLAPSTAAPAIWLTWWLGDIGGVVLLAPVIVLWWTDRRSSVDPRRVGLEIAVVIAAALAASGAGAPGAPLGVVIAFMFAGLFALLFGAVRFGPRIGATASLAFAVPTIVAALAGSGPFQQSDPNEMLLILQVFLTFLASTTLALGAAAAAGQHRRSMDPAADDMARPGVFGRFTAAAVAAMAVVPLAMGAAMIGLVTDQLSGQLEQERLDERSQLVATGLRRAIETAQQDVRGLAAFFSTQEQVGVAEFQHYVRSSGMIQRQSGVRAVEFARMVDDVASYEQAVRNDTSFEDYGLAPFTVHPASDSSIHYVVELLEPVTTNEVTWGLDLSANASRRNLVEAALGSDVPVLSGPLTLVQGDADTIGLLLMMRVTDSGGTGIGVIATVHEVAAMVKREVEAAAAGRFRAAVEVVDRGQVAQARGGPGQIIYTSGDRPPAATGVEGETLVVASRVWNVRLFPLDNVLSGPERAAPWALVAGTGAISVLLAALVHATASTRERARRLADLRTAQLQEAEHRIRAVVEDVQGYAILRLDSQGRCAWWNKGAGQLTGYRESEILGKSLEYLYPPAERRQKLHSELVETARSEGRATWSGRMLRKDGTAFWCTVSVTNVGGGRGDTRAPGAGVDSGFSYVVQDVTNARDAERRLEEAVKDQEELLRRLKISNKDLEQFAYVASHDLQAPLRHISGFAELLEARYGQQLDADARRNIQFIVDGARRMRDLILGLLEFSRVDRSDAPFGPVDFKDACAQAALVLAADFEAAGATVEFGEMPVVRGDASQVLQLMQNLLQNSLKYRGTAALRVQVSTTTEDGWVTVAVRDNGIGFKAEHAERIFLMFQRLEETAAAPGTGIGLALCQRIVARHGGKIWAESEPLKGATFFFTLPTAT